MIKNIEISGFSDEISSELDTQLKIVSELGMRYISLRGVDGENISEYSVESIQNNVLPRLNQWGIGISSIGSTIDIIYINYDEKFKLQLKSLKLLCEIAIILDCKYIRIFSLYIPKEDNFDEYEKEVIVKLKQFSEIAQQYNIVLRHENE